MLKTKSTKKIKEDDNRVTPLSYLISIIIHALIVLLFSFLGLAGGGKASAPPAKASYIPVDIVSIYRETTAQAESSVEEQSQQPQVNSPEESVPVPEEVEMPVVPKEKKVETIETKPIPNVEPAKQTTQPKIKPSPLVQKPSVSMEGNIKGKDNGLPGSTGNTEGTPTPFSGSGSTPSPFPGDTGMPTLLPGREKIETDFSKSAQNTELQGYVIFKIQVLPEGTIGDVMLDDGTMDNDTAKIANRNIKKAGKESIFKPKITQGKPVEAWIKIKCTYVTDETPICEMIQ